MESTAKELMSEGSTPFLRSNMTWILFKEWVRTFMSSTEYGQFEQKWTSPPKISWYEFHDWCEVNVLRMYSSASARSQGIIKNNERSPSASDQDSPHERTIPNLGEEQCYIVDHPFFSWLDEKVSSNQPRGQKRKSELPHTPSPKRNFEPINSISSTNGISGTMEFARRPTLSTESVVTRLRSSANRNRNGSEECTAETVSTPTSTTDRCVGSALPAASPPKNGPENTVSRNNRQRNEYIFDPGMEIRFPSQVLSTRAVPKIGVYATGRNRHFIDRTCAERLMMFIETATVRYRSVYPSGKYLSAFAARWGSGNQNLLRQPLLDQTNRGRVALRAVLKAITLHDWVALGYKELVVAMSSGYLYGYMAVSSRHQMAKMRGGEEEVAFNDLWAAIQHWKKAGLAIKFWLLKPMWIIDLKGLAVTTLPPARCDEAGISVKNSRTFESGWRTKEERHLWSWKDGDAKSRGGWQEEKEESPQERGIMSSSEQLDREALTSLRRISV